MKIMLVLTPVTLLFTAFGYVQSLESIVKCCGNGQILNEFMKCELNPNASNPLVSILDLSHEIIDINSTCFMSNEKETANSSSEMQTFLNLPCADIGLNGSLIFQNCSSIHKHDEQKTEKCRSFLTPLKFWGASIVVFASFIYIFPYSSVVVLYCFMHDLRRKAFDKGVMCFCLSQAGTAAILCVLGYFVLCDTPIPAISYSVFGLTLMFLTISSVLCMFIMCFDVTLTITRFRWAPASTSNDQIRKFRMYASWVYGGAFVPSIFIAIIEFVPFIPKDSRFKPNFEHFGDTNLAVIAYVAVIPVLVCLANNILFVYTSWKMYEIQKSTSMVHENRKDAAKKKYIMYLKLYFLMDAPWVTSTLGAVYPDLWILKFFRMVHPILLLMTILPRKMVVRFLNCAKPPATLKNAGKDIANTKINITKDEKLSKKENNPPVATET